MSKHKPGRSIWSHYGYLWATLGLFLLSLIGHWMFAWSAFVDEQLQHGGRPETGQFFVETMRDTLENWQSEFLQLMWQVAGLALLYHIGSPQSKEGNDRLEEKIDRILKAVDEEGAAAISKLDKAYLRD
ncbi:MAG: DUF6766 family protein [Vicinamibacterales bacterium]